MSCLQVFSQHLIFFSSFLFYCWFSFSFCILLYIFSLPIFSPPFSSASFLPLLFLFLVSSVFTFFPTRLLTLFLRSQFICLHSVFLFLFHSPLQTSPFPSPPLSCSLLFNVATSQNSSQLLSSYCSMRGSSG